MIAVAEQVQKLKQVDVLFVGTLAGMEAQVVPKRGYPIEFLKVLPLRGHGLVGAAKGAWQVSAAVAEARALLLKYKPQAVFSAGGYAAGPISLAARILGIPVALMEPNSVAGLANRLMAPFVQRAYTAFATCEKHFSKRVVLRSGVPIRSGFSPVPYASEPGISPLRVLVLGGSQGARTLNQAVPQALARCARATLVRHQCGKVAAAEVEASYRDLGLGERATILPFIENMAEALAWAQLVISRSGASAVSEICAVGRPSLLIPYPFAAGDHQRYNAESLAEAGAAIAVLSERATPEKLATVIEALTRTPATLAQMAAKAVQLGRPDAAVRIAEDLLALAGLAAWEAPKNSVGSKSRDDTPLAPFRSLELS